MANRKGLVNMTYDLPFKPRSHPWITGAIAVLLMGSIGTYFFLAEAQNPSHTGQNSIVEVIPVQAVTALGRLEPQGETIKLSVANAADSRVNQLLVHEGDWVEAGQVIARLQGLDKKQAELAEAREHVAIYQARLEQVRTGEAKIAEMDAQRSAIAQLQAQLRTETIERQASVARREAERRNAEQSYERYRQLHDAGAIEAITLDDRRETLETARANLAEAQASLENTQLTLQAQIRQEQARLAQLQEVRPIDLQVAQAELDYASAQVHRIEVELDDFSVRVPVAGRILKINTRVGEQVNTSQGIVELGRTDQMYAIAEVYETDVSRVKLGQRAEIISEHGGFEGEIHGGVDHIGMQIKKQDVLGADPAADKDARVVEVKVRIDPEDNAKVMSLTNLQVRITLDLTDD